MAARLGPVEILANPNTISDPGSIPVTAWYPERDLDPMDRYHELGVQRVVFSVPSATAETVLPALDEIGALMAKVTL
jgi:hypothetical protein